MDTVVYWLYDEACFDPATDGYIGLTCNIDDRIKGHRKVKKLKFKFFKIIFCGSRSECAAEEKRLRPHPDIGWNISAGGFSGRGKYGPATRLRISLSHKHQRNRLGQKHSEESKKKFRARRHTEETLKKLRARKHSEESKRKMSASLKGRIITEEQRVKISAALKGRIKSPETRAKLSASLTGLKRSPEACANNGAAKKGHKLNLGKKFSDEHKRKLSLAHMGHKPSEETRAKMRASSKAYRDKPEYRAKLSEAGKRRHQRDRDKLCNLLQHETSNVETLTEGKANDLNCPTVMLDLFSHGVSP